MKYLDSYNLHEGYNWKEDLLKSDTESKVDNIKDILTELTDIGIECRIIRNYTDSNFITISSKNDLAKTTYYREYTISITKTYNGSNKVNAVDSFIEFNNAMNYVVKMLNMDFHIALFDQGHSFIIKALDMDSPLDKRLVMSDKQLRNIKISETGGIYFYVERLNKFLSEMTRIEVVNNTIIIHPTTKTLDFLLPIIKRIFKLQLSRELIYIRELENELRIDIKKV